MKNGVIAGGVGIWLDEIVPCLKDTETGEIKETGNSGKRILHQQMQRLQSMLLRALCLRFFS